jgi:GT2 family glycosyltransferase
MDQKVLIGVPTAEYARRGDFYDHFNIIEKPVGTVMTFARGQSPARNRNIIIDQAKEIKATHILFIDDDVLCPPDTLMRLLKHDKDIVTGLYLMRHFPHKPIAFVDSDDQGRCTYLELTPDKTGLIEIKNAGLGCCLIKTSVFDQLEKPYIRLGECVVDHWCDDIGFFNRVRKAGIQLYCDLDVRCGHIASFVLRPTFVNNQWVTGYDTAGTQTVSIPQNI